MAEAKKPTDRDIKKEMEALTKIVAVLEPLTDAERSRILKYAKDRFGIYTGDA